MKFLEKGSSKVIFSLVCIAAWFLWKPVVSFLVEMPKDRLIFLFWIYSWVSFTAVVIIDNSRDGGFSGMKRISTNPFYYICPLLWLYLPYLAVKYLLAIADKYLSE